MTRILRTVGLSIVLLLAWSRVEASAPRLIGSDDAGVTVEMSALDYRLGEVAIDGAVYATVALPAAVPLPYAGEPAVPVAGTVVGIPFGVDVRVEVVDADYVTIPGVLLAPVPDVDRETGLPVYVADRLAYEENRWFPADAAVVNRVGIIRDQRVAGVSLRPIQYNPVTRTLRVASRLRVRLSFDRNAGSRPVLRRPATPESVFEPVYRSQILNARESAAWRARGPTTARAKQASFWYDPVDDWFRVPIEQDGLYALDADWFEASGIPLAGADPTRLQMFVDGAEIPLLVEDGGDESIDEGDRVLFYGEYRRAADRDFESRFGRTHTYWLRFGSQAGKRFDPVDGTPSGGSPAPWVWQTVHVEIDSVYERLGEAPDVDRDHWFYKRTASPSSPGGQEFPVSQTFPLPGLDATADADATVRVGMHGISLRDEVDLDHRTRVEVQDGIPVTEDRWDGQTAFIAEGTVAADRLVDTLTVTLRTPGSPEFPTEPIAYIDHVRLNWTAVTYPADTRVIDGWLRFTTDEAADYAIGGLASPSPVILDVENGMLVTNGAVSGDGDAFAVAFSGEAGRFLVVDENAILPAPVATADAPSTLRTDPTGASYVIVTDPLFAAQAEALAAHRRSTGLTAMVVDIRDVYDEFSFGDLTETAIRDFVTYAYENWSTRPAYLTLFGRMTYDYRDLMDQAKNLRVPRIPAMPFQSVRRGQAFTDHLYGTVSGDDPFMDVWVGRVSVNRVDEAATVVSKIVAYDEAPDAAWRSKALFMANWDREAGETLFINDSDRLIAESVDPLGLETFRVYHTADTPTEPNESSSEVISQFNDGRLIVNFMGHGSAASMQKFIAGTFQQRGFNYMAQLNNTDRLPLVIAMSCLNGLYDEPTLICFAEEMVNKPDGGSIAYVSASSLAFVFVNNEINESTLRYLLREEVREFGAALGMAKTDLLAAMPGIDNGVFVMNLMGDPAQRLAIPSGPDYAIEASGVSVTGGADVLSTSDTARVAVSVRNEGVIIGEALEILVLDRGIDDGRVDTVGATSLAPFGQTDSTAVLWPLAGKTGRRQVEVILDPDGRLTELRTDNNRAAVEVEVFGRLSGVAAFPISSQQVTSPVRMGVRTGLTTTGPVFGEFELSREDGFADPVVRSGPVAASSGLAVWTSGVLEAGTWFWRARMTDGSEAGAWTAVRTFTVGEPAPARSVAWRQDAAEALRSGMAEGIVTYEDGTAGRTTEPLPIRITADFREETIIAEGVPATAVLATDGTFHFVKGFFSSPQSYPDSDTFIKVGSGFNGTRAGENLGPASDPAIPTVSATYHGDGFIYADNRQSREIVRISPSTGETTVVPVPDGLLEIRSGLVFDGHSLLSSDGSLIYNVANGVNGIPRAGWMVRVFDPQADWSVVREFEVEPTSTGFSFAFTDGVIADGEYLYLVEFSTGASHRVRVVSALDGSFVEEYQSDQAETDLLSGQYDWVNNKVWFGQLNGNAIYRYTGRRLPDEGILMSSAIGPASAWQSLVVDTAGGTARAHTRVDLLGETAQGTFLPIAEWSGLQPGTIDLTDLDNTIDRIKVRVRLSGEGLGRTASLSEWRVDYRPVTDVSIANLQVSATEVRELEPVILSVDATNRGPIDIALGAAVAFYAGEPGEGRVIGRQAVPENTEIGVPRRIEFAWITAKFAGTHRVTARVEDLFGNAAFFPSTAVSASLVEVTPSLDATLPLITIEALEASGEVRSGDYLPADTDFRITLADTSGIERSSIEVVLSSEGVTRPPAGFGSNLVSEQQELPGRTSFRYSAPLLDDGTHTLEVRGEDRLGNGPATKTLSFQVTSDLRLEQVLAYPNPMATDTDFTFILSRPSEVVVKVYTVAGRLVRTLDLPVGRAGYNQLHWDGLDKQGRAIANGTYLYTVTADDGETRVRKKETLIVYR